MLSRGTSSASQRPRRAKSTPSVRSQSIFSMAPSKSLAETTHQQALTAASLAFERANDRAVAEKGPDGQDATSAAQNEEGPKLGRRQSVRFTGPTAIPLRNRSITRRETPGHRTDHHPNESQLVSKSHSIEPSFSSDDRALVASAQPFGEFGESDNASVPSSYRKLRKAKSMFSPAKAPSAVFSDGVPSSRHHFHRQSLQSSDSCHEPFRAPDPRLRNSYSFLRGVTDRVSTSSRQYVTNDAAVQLARDQYLRQLEQQRLKEQPSFLSLGNRGKPRKAFRRTVRTSSTNSYGSAIASPLASLEPPTVKTLGHRARSLSQTIKKKIKRVFKRSSDIEGTLPVQQIEASHTHYGDYIFTQNGKEQRYPPVPEPDAELLLRVNSRESVASTTPFNVDKGGRAGSVRSAHSDDDESNDKSRVTSWTDSTAANTIIVPQTLERKRLSIIKEDGGPHQPSSSARLYEGTSDGYASFRQPVRQSSAGRVSGPIDSKRIFSALQKKIDENNRKAALDDSEPGTDSSPSHRKARLSKRTPTRTSSIRKYGKTKLDPLYRPHGPKVSNSVIFSPSAMETFNNNFYQHEIASDDQEHKQQDFSDQHQILSLQQIAGMNEHGIPLPKRPLREVKSAFFPPSMHIERSKPSPYRRAMHTSNEVGADYQNGADFGRPGGPSTAVTGRLRTGSVTESISIYSRSSGGDTPKANRSSISLAMSESSGEAGTAIIIMDHEGRHEQSAHPAVVQRGYSSLASSGNWRNFMASQVASLEDFGTRQEQTDDALEIKDSGHIRENAQVDSDGVIVGRLQSPIVVPNQPLAIIQGKSNPPRVSKQHQASHSPDDRSPLRSIGISCNAGNVLHNGSTPLSRNSEYLPKPSDMENERRTLSRVHEPSSTVRQKTSRSTLKTQTDQRRSPATVNVRCSPERAERLRRLKSSSCTSLGKPASQNNDRASRHTPGSEKDHGREDSDTSPVFAQTRAGNNHKMVNSFLKTRRSVMRMSEDSGTDPAFL